MDVGKASEQGVDDEQGKQGRKRKSKLTRIFSLKSTDEPTIRETQETKKKKKSAIL